MKKTDITAEPGKHEIITTWVFDAPHMSSCSRHAQIQISYHNGGDLNTSQQLLIKWM